MEVYSRRFIPIYLTIIFSLNFIALVWACQPQSIGGYVGLAFIPVNFLAIIIGLVYNLVCHFKKKIKLAYRYYLMVLLTPVAAQIILLGLIDVFARKGGC